MIKVIEDPTGLLIISLKLVDEIRSSNYSFYHILIYFFASVRDF